MLSKSYFDYDLFVLESENGDMQYDIVDEGSISDAISSFMNRITKSIKCMSGHKEEKKNRWVILSVKSTSSDSPHKNFKVTKKIYTIDTKKTVNVTQSAVNNAIYLMNKLITTGFNSSDNDKFEEIYRMLVFYHRNKKVSLTEQLIGKNLQDTVIQKDVSASDMCTMSNTAMQSAGTVLKIYLDATNRAKQIANKMENNPNISKDDIDREGFLHDFIFILIGSTLTICESCAAQAQDNAEEIVKEYDKKYPDKQGSILINYKEIK